MAIRATYSDSAWAAHEWGAHLADMGGPFRMPCGLSQIEQNAFCEGCDETLERKQNQLLVSELKGMLGGTSFERVMRELVRR